MKATLTAFISDNNLSKHFTLADDGTIQKAINNTFYSGTAQWVKLRFPEDMAELMAECGPNVALGYGLNEKKVIGICTRDSPKHGCVARTQQHFAYSDSEPGLLMLDHDSGDLRPDELIRLIHEIMPESRRAAFYWRHSVSAGVVKTGGMRKLKPGFHLWFAVKKPSDIPRFGKALYRHLWLIGYGSIDLSKSGAMLERCAIDASVFDGSRLDFVGAPTIGEGLELLPPLWGAEAGAYLDTEMLSDLSNDARFTFDKLVANAKRKMQPQIEKAQQAKFNEIRAYAASEVSDKAIWTQVRGSCYELSGFTLLEFADGRMATVDDVIDYPLAFDQCALADPVEGKAYGATTAKFYANLEGKMCINSFAHGGVIYRLKRTVPPGMIANILTGELSEKEEKRLMVLSDEEKRLYDKKI